MNNSDRHRLPGRINFRIIIGFLISGILLWLTFRSSGLQIGNIQLDKDQLWYFFIAICIFIFSLWFYALRARLIWLNEIKKKPVIDTYSSLVLGNFYNCLLPGNLGEGIRAWHFCRKNDVYFSRSLAAIITEKWIDAQLFIFLVIALFTIRSFVSHYISYTLVYTALIVAVLSAIHVLMRSNRYIEKRLWLIALSLGGAGKFLFRTYTYTNGHLDNLRKKGVSLYYIILCMIIFFLNVLQFFFLQKAAGVSGPVAGWYSSCLISLTMMIIAFVPSAPSNIGVLHYGIYSALILASMQYGIKPNVTSLPTFALFAVYVHLSFIIPEILLGAVYVVKERKFLFKIGMPGSKVRLFDWLP
jgi:uncharacterized membrane protein YbhN (UPF0104 family)